MSEWVLIGIVVFIIVLSIILKRINKNKYQVTRMPGSLEEKSKFQKFLDKCCRHKT